jgi:hypothetical protein
MTWLLLRTSVSSDATVGMGVGSDHVRGHAAVLRQSFSHWYFYPSSWLHDTARGLDAQTPPLSRNLGPQGLKELKVFSLSSRTQGFS